MSMKGLRLAKPKIAPGEGKTKQSFREQSDINSIVARYRRNGSFDNVSRAAPVFADVSHIGDYRTICHKIRLATEAFEALPAAVRTRFANDATKLLDFLKDPKNDAEAIELGLREAPKVPGSKPVKAVVPAVKPAVAVKPVKKALVEPDSCSDE